MADQQNVFGVYQPQGAAARMLQARQQQNQMRIANTVLNEETEKALGGDGTSVDVASAVPKAMFEAARRLSALGDQASAQALYAKGVAAAEAAKKSTADLDKIRAETKNLNDPTGEYTNVLNERDMAAEQVNKFPEGTPTRNVLQGRLDSLNERLSSINAATGGSGGGSVAGYVKVQNAARDAAHQPRMTPAEIQTYADRLQQTSSIEQDYKKYTDQGGELSQAQWLPGYLATKGASTKAGEVGVVDVSKLEDDAQKASQEKAYIGYALNFLNKGANTGTAAEARTWFARALDTFIGKQTDMNQLVSNTAGYTAATTQLVLDRIRLLAPASDTDRKYLASVLGGDTSLDENSLRKVLEIAARSNDMKIDRYNKRLGNLGDEFKTVYSAGLRPVENPTLDFAAPKITRPPPGSTPDQIAKFYLQPSK